jgi:hypothetical protein
MFANTNETQYFVIPATDLRKKEDVLNHIDEVNQEISKGGSKNKPYLY